MKVTAPTPYRVTAMPESLVHSLTGNELVA